MCPGSRAGSARHERGAELPPLEPCSHPCACFEDRTKPSCDGDSGLGRQRVLQSWRRNGRNTADTKNSGDVSKQWGVIIQKCELQEGVLPGLKPSRNLVVSGLRDPKETFISLTKLAFMCPGFGRALEEFGCSTGSGSYRSCF